MRKYLLAALLCTPALGAVPTRDYAMVQVTTLDGHHAEPSAVTQCITSYARLDQAHGMTVVKQEIGAAVGLLTAAPIAIDDLAEQPSVAFGGNVSALAQQAAAQAEPLQGTTLNGSCPIAATGRHAVFVVLRVPGRGIVPVLVGFRCMGQGITAGAYTPAGALLSAALTVPPSACAALRGG
jgi:hypothetical protein